MTESEPTLEEIEADLERARELETEAAIDLLRSARAALGARRTDSSTDDDRVAALETRLEQRIREVKRRDAYDSGLGAAMNPDEDDAP